MLNYGSAPSGIKVKVKEFIKSNESKSNSHQLAELVAKKFNVIISERTIRDMLQRIRESLDEVGETLEKAIEAVNEEEKKKYEILEKD